MKAAQGKMYLQMTSVGHMCSCWFVTTITYVNVSLEMLDIRNSFKQYNVLDADDVKCIIVEITVF